MPRIEFGTFFLMPAQAPTKEPPNHLGTCIRDPGKNRLGMELYSGKRYKIFKNEACMLVREI